MTTPLSTSSSPGPFRSYPQKYPKARQRALTTASTLQKLVELAPHSQVATVVDTAFHVSQGYILAQTNSTVTRVYSVPYGSVVPGMRLYVRQLGSLKTNMSHVFDGYAPNLSGLGMKGSVLVSSTPSGSTPLCSSGGITATDSTASLGTSTGYYWHCFFYLPVLPTTPVTLFHFLQVTGGTNAVSLEYLPSGYVQFRSQDNHGYITNSTVPPHVAHWVMIQPGLASKEFLVDTVSNYTGIASPSDVPTFTGGGQTYAIAYLSTMTGTQPAPIGSWVSKMGYGTSYNAGVVTLTNSTPVYDTQLPNQNISTTQRTRSLYLCEDAPGVTLTNSGFYGSGGNLTVATSSVSIQIPGPY